MKSLAQAQIKRVKALELAAEGCSYEEIARRTGFSHRGSAHRAVFKALEHQEAEGVDQLRRLELDRLDALQENLWQNAIAGDVAAVTAVIRIIEARARLLGLQPRGRPTTDNALMSLVLDP